MEKFNSCHRLEALISEHIHKLTSSPITHLSSVISQSMCDAAAWFELDRISLFAFESRFSGSPRTITQCCADYAQLPPKLQKLEAGHYTRQKYSHPHHMQVFDAVSLQTSDIDCLVELYRHGVRWHCLHPLTVFGEYWGVTVYSRLGGEYMPLHSHMQICLKLLAQVWAACSNHVFALDENRHLISSHQPSLQQFPLPEQPGCELSLRQQQVLSLLASGMTAQQCADELVLSRRTIESHKYRIMEQLNISTSAELVSYAVNMGLLAGK